MEQDQLKHRGDGTLVEHLGLEFEYAEAGNAAAHLTVAPFHLAPNGYLHAASIIALADSCCGYGCLASLPDGAHNFTTVELKSNFLGTATSGRIRCEARLVHGGRTTQVWDAVVSNESAKTIALFRCTQLLLYPR